MAFNLLGVPAEVPLMRELASKNIGDSNTSISNAILKGLIDRSVADDQNYPPLNELEFEMEQDRFVVKAIGAIMRQKEIAVTGNQFSIAKTLKEMQTVFAAAGSDLNTISRRKATAILTEDYDLARILQVILF